MRWLCLLICIALFTFGLGQIKPSVVAAEELQRIILINVEGLNYEAYISTPMHNLRQIAAEGLMDEKCLAIRTDSSEAALASLLTGALPEDHGYYNSESKIQVESLLALLKKHGRTFQLIDGSGGKLQVFNYGQDQYIALPPSSLDQEAFSRLIQNIPEQMPFFSFLYLNDSLEALLALDDNQYYSALMTFDSKLVQLISELKNHNMYQDSLIIITSARSTSPSDYVPMIIRGPGCRSGVKTSSSIVLDTVATICSFMGVNAPASSIGIPIYDAMTVRQEDREYVYVKWTADLKKERILQFTRYYDMQDELYRTIHQMTAIKEERQNIFEFAGEREKIINSLESRINWQRVLGMGIFLLMLAGYLLEYRWLKKKFTLFQ
jgi:membrane-anchored protein YejM (alkaline phosphatase superfamily)